MRTSVFWDTKTCSSRYISEDGALHSQCCEDPKAYPSSCYYNWGTTSLSSQQILARTMWTQKVAALSAGSAVPCTNVGSGRINNIFSLATFMSALWWVKYWDGSNKRERTHTDTRLHIYTHTYARTHTFRLFAFIVNFRARNIYWQGFFIIMK
jgi:hypothetical protein